jgi:16S rRNA C1402 (ribose-2'-O) methylase RsmI
MAKIPQLSAKTFISNVITQVVERHLLQGLLNIFSWVKINRMTEETVIAIAAENEETRNKRLELKAKLKSIEDARDICASLAMRKELRAVSRNPDELQIYNNGWGLTMQYVVR